MDSVLTSPFDFPPEYFFGLTLVVAAVVNILLAIMLLLDSNNYIYADSPRYLRSRWLTATALAVFGTGFLLHWLFMPHFNNLLTAKALSFTYFHIGGVLFSMSHTGLIDRHYLTRQVVVRDITLLLISLIVYWANAFVADQALTYVGSSLFFLHIGYLTWQFYSRFTRIYYRLSNFADYRPNDTDHEVLWLHYSCHLIILFGIGGMLCTVLFHDATLPFTILLIMGIAVFSYIYKSLDSFGAIACEAEGNISGSEEYLSLKTRTDADVDATPFHDAADEAHSKDDIKDLIEHWVAERHFTDYKLTLSDALNQMDITEQSLTLYLERHTSFRGYRQWLSYLRIEEAKRLMLLYPNYSIQAIAEECGYAIHSSLSRSFKLQEGMTPSQWYKKNR